MVSDGDPVAFHNNTLDLLSSISPFCVEIFAALRRSVVVDRLALWLIPRPLRDIGYRLVAANRFRWFGKKETCRLPSLAERERFLP